MEPLDLETGKLSLSAKSLLLLAAGVCTTGFAVYKVVQQEVEAEASVHRQQMQAYHDQIVAITETIKDSRDDAVRHSNAIEGLKVQMAADREAIRTQLAAHREVQSAETAALREYMTLQLESLRRDIATNGGDIREVRAQVAAQARAGHEDGKE